MSKPVLRETSSLSRPTPHDDDVLSKRLISTWKALIRATRDLEKGFKQHGLEEGDESVKMSGCFGCFGGKVPTGGTTVTSASIQRGLMAEEAMTFYIVCGRVRFRGAFIAASGEHDLTMRGESALTHKRLTREHNAHDPLEAQVYASGADSENAKSGWKRDWSFESVLPRFRGVPSGRRFRRSRDYRRTEVTRVKVPKRALVTRRQ